MARTMHRCCGRCQGVAPSRGFLTDPRGIEGDKKDDNASSGSKNPLWGHMRYVVIGPSWGDMGDTLAGWSGTVLARFMSLDRAKALTLQRMAYGDTGIVVVDSASGRQTYPPESPLARRTVTMSGRRDG